MATIRCGEHQFENISAVVFDKDGTLANVEDYLRKLSRERIRQIANVVPRISTFALAATMGVEDGSVDPTGLMAIASRRDTEIAMAAYVAARGRGWRESVAIVHAAFERAKAQMPNQAAQSPLVEGGRSLTTRIRATKTKVGVVSSDTHTAVGEFIEHHNLASKVDWYCGSSYESPDKTAPNFLSFVCDALGTLPAQTLVIGDSSSDLALARQGAAGFVATVGGWRRPPRKLEADAVVRQFSEVECFH